MSIATLKRKTQTKYNNMSVNTGTGFSLNGTTRNQGYIGQTSLSRTLVRTLRNGTAVRGHGGCCTDASKAPILQAEFTNLEDNNVVKKSSLSTMGMLKRRYNNKNYNFVKPDSNNNLNTSQYHTDKKKKDCIRCTESTINPDATISCCKECNPNENNVTKPIETYMHISGSQYVEDINKKCLENDIIFAPTANKRTPFAGFN
tara:strand:- start:402 stop:1007 length:606 start_codon:yes stop_codon:yes gene_type:complete